MQLGRLEHYPSRVQRLRRCCRRCKNIDTKTSQVNLYEGVAGVGAMRELCRHFSPYVPHNDMEHWYVHAEYHFSRYSYGDSMDNMLHSVLSLHSLSISWNLLERLFGALWPFLLDPLEPSGPFGAFLERPFGASLEPSWAFRSPHGRQRDTLNFFSL